MDYAKIMKFLTSKGEEQEKALDELNPEEVLKSIPKRIIWQSAQGR